MLNWQSLQVTLAGSTHVRCEIGWQLDRAWSDRLADYDLWLVWAGRGSMELSSGKIDLYPGLCLWMRPGGVYVGQQDPNDRLGVSAQHFDLVSSKTGKRLADHQLPPETIHVTDIPAMTGIMRRIADLNRQARKAHPNIADKARSAAETYMHSLLMDLAFMAQAPPTTNNPTQQMHRQIITQLAADMAASPQDIASISQLAKTAGYSSAHFSRIFHQIMGTSPQHYLMEARIHRARQLLVETNWSITRIAQVMGYNDVFFFSKQFKHITGKPPSTMR